MSGSRRPTLRLRTGRNDGPAVLFHQLQSGPRPLGDSEATANDRSAPHLIRVRTWRSGARRSNQLHAPDRARRVGVRATSAFARRYASKACCAARADRTDPLLQRQHADAVAWRTLLEWLKVQAAIIETEQAAPDEVMLPYMLVPSANGQRSTAYQQFAQTALPAGVTA